jgi:hypothetical protein
MSGRKKDITKFFYRIDHFIDEGESTSIRPQYLRRFRNIPILPLSEIEFEGFTDYGKKMFKAIPGFTDFFYEVILCNNFSYFDELQGDLELKGVSFRGRFLYVIIIYELARIQIEIDNSFIQIAVTISIKKKGLTMIPMRDFVSIKLRYMIWAIKFRRFMHTVVIVLFQFIKRL